MEWFDEKPFRTPMPPQVPMPTTRPRIDQYDDKNKQLSKIPKPSKSLEPRGVGASERASLQIKRLTLQNIKDNISFLERKLRNTDFV